MRAAQVLAVPERVVAELEAWSRMASMLRGRTRKGGPDTPAHLFLRPIVGLRPTPSSWEGDPLECALRHPLLRRRRRRRGLDAGAGCRRHRQARRRHRQARPRGFPIRRVDPSATCLRPRIAPSCERWRRRLRSCRGFRTSSTRWHWRISRSSGPIPNECPRPSKRRRSAKARRRNAVDTQVGEAHRRRRRRTPPAIRRGASRSVRETQGGAGSSVRWVPRILGPVLAGTDDHLSAARLRPRRLGRVARRLAARAVVVDLSLRAANRRLASGLRCAAVESLATAVGVPAPTIGEISARLRNARDALVIGADFSCGAGCARLFHSAPEVHDAATDHSSRVERGSARIDRTANAVVTDFAILARSAARLALSTCVRDLPAGGRGAAQRGARRANASRAMRPRGAAAAGDAAASARVGHRSAKGTSVLARALGRRSRADAAAANLSGSAGTRQGVAAAIGNAAAKVTLPGRGAGERRALARISRSGGRTLIVHACHGRPATTAPDGNAAPVNAHDAATAGAYFGLTRLRRRVTRIGAAHVCAGAGSAAREGSARARIDITPAPGR
jgi:hypothetical protein